MTKSSSASQQSRRQPDVQKIPTLKYIGRGKYQDRARLLESIPDAFISLDTQWQITYVNQQAEAVVGKTRADVLGRMVWDVFPIPTDCLLYLKAHEAMDTQRSLEMTAFHPLLKKWFAVRLYSFQDGLYVFGQDITERTHAEALLQFQANTSWDASKSIIVTNLDGKIIYWNQAASVLFGYSAQEMLGQTPAVLYSELEKEQLAADLEQIRSGHECVGNWVGRRKDGSTVWIEIKTSLLSDREGKPFGYIGLVQPMAHPEPAEEQFLYYARIAQNQLDAVIATDANYNIVSWNEAAERLYGWKQEEVLGKHVNALLPTQFFTTSCCEASRQLRSRGYWKGKVVQPRKDGTPLTILASVSLIKEASGKIIGAIAANRDLSEYEEKR